MYVCLTHITRISFLTQAAATMSSRRDKTRRAS